jgi:hypothetical protein
MLNLTIDILKCRLNQDYSRSFLTSKGLIYYYLANKTTTKKDCVAIVPLSEMVKKLNLSQETLYSSLAYLIDEGYCRWLDENRNVVVFSPIKNHRDRD